MYLYERILNTVRGWIRPKPRKNFALFVDTDTLVTLKHLARQANTTPEEVAYFFISSGIHTEEIQRENKRQWDSLSQREQEVAARICLGYTYLQIADELAISHTTVKTYVGRILHKFNASSREMLRLRLSGWNFSAWER